MLVTNGIKLWLDDVAVEHVLDATFDDVLPCFGLTHFLQLPELLSPIPTELQDLNDLSRVKLSQVLVSILVLGLKTCLTIRNTTLEEVNGKVCHFEIKFSRFLYLKAFWNSFGTPFLYVFESQFFNLVLL